ncbi:MAG: fumarate reductase cytochrome b subunit [Desulfamplus sp.]|nr:fumarate reductase cytochrome b subunit [Desulfamplus sp.]
MESLIINDRIKKSRIPARLDMIQSGTGLILGLFMWVHMILVGSIILGKDAFNFVAKFMELSFLSDTGHGYPAAVFFAVLGVFTLFIIHAALGVRKFPISWKQHAIIRNQMSMINHEDTNLWYVQVVTGFIMFFLGSVHLYVMLTNPGQIDPYLSADRVISQNMWPLYLVLLFAVELHGTIGLYRLCMKWGWFDGDNPGENRKKLKLLKNRLTIFFLGLGLLALLVFSVIGIRHKDRAGERYNPQAAEVEVHLTEQKRAGVDTEHSDASLSDSDAGYANAVDSDAADAVDSHAADAVDSHTADESAVPAGVDQGAGSEETAQE